ncbi:F-box DNA helicase 1-like [Alosa sapidissima]|uniref:F-box DNA helicase 1-like n=1 Tax=Alosa sapidissima TaxID=34773 RepID=UPI001C095BDE|nr:F-box DNA helicase 1-like [Alosa sapidissima]
MPANQKRLPGRSPRTQYSTKRRSRDRKQELKVVQDLPETMLRAILAMLPAPDLFLRANLVCRQWRNIISSEGFCRWKKCYIRYHQQEEVGKQEVISILQENRMTPDDNNNLCLLHMAKYMSQTFHCMTVGSERDRENRILECIRSHRLYEQARACMPESMKQMEVPWSSLALMLVLADGVEELWQLVVRLRSPLTPEQLSEFLWCSATLLRAMADKRVKISNRLHYNIYYVLHIMENILPSNRSEADQDSENQMTPEQQQILNHNTEEDHVVKIMAFAGTGKTTTLVRYAEQRPSLRFLYVVFNKSAQMQAQSIFPDNVSCKTIHSLAHAAVGQRYRDKLIPSLNILAVFWVLPKGERSIVRARLVTQTINNFWASTDPHMDNQHVPGCTSDDKPHKEREILENACCIWDRMKEVENTPEAAYHMYHDGYLKLWQLEGSQIKHDEHYDVIFIDDAQDCTPVMLHILLSQPCAKILVGDPHQHIYSFRGAINNLNTIQHTHIYYLTQSFRFGPEIAYVGVTILEVGKDVKKTMVGGNQRDSVRGQDVEMRQRYQTGVGGADGRLAILSRTNASIFHEAVRLTGLNPTSRIYIIGGIKAFGLSTIRDIWALKQREHGLNLPIESDFIRLFSEGAMDGLKGYAGLCQYAEKDDKELMWKITVVNKYGKCILELVEQIRSQQCRQQCDADFILSSVHKAKGLEFDTVFITDDFRALQALPAQEQGGNQSIIEEDEWNLIYVAVTRAKRTVFITRTITNILARAGEYFLRSELTTVPAENLVRNCSICSSHLHLNTRMHRLPITYVNDVENGGPLCLPCVNKKAGQLACLMSPGIRQIPFP